MLAAAERREFFFEFRNRAAKGSGNLTAPQSRQHRLNFFVSEVRLVN
jgi:hypothetical protein